MGIMLMSRKVHGGATPLHLKVSDARLVKEGKHTTLVQAEGRAGDKD